MQWIRVTFPSSKAEGAVLMWLSESGLLSAHRTAQGKRDTAHEFPYSDSETGEIRHEEQTESLVWQPPLPLSLNLTCFYIHREFLKKKP